MKTGFYPKLAWQGIRKNGKIYIPYIITSIAMVMMYYIVSFLSVNKSIGSMRDGKTIQDILGYGVGIIAVFTAIFLFYTNSFIIRRRKKEFGLYNILGMGKWNIARILVWETLILLFITLAAGLGCGILFSKLAELLALKIMDGNVQFEFTIETGSIISSVILFSIIFGLILFYSLGQIHVSKPVELLSSDKSGEKPPKARWLISIIGMALLVYSYYLSVTIENPVDALNVFFLAVIMVIAATYILFILGSVVLCRVLQKNKNYYYKTSHFVSVSSMAYRMKKNGASLASICILSTMVLVMISSTMGLYIGKEENFNSRYPRDIVIETYSDAAKYTDKVHEAVADVLSSSDVKEEKLLTYSYLPVAGYQTGDHISFNLEDSASSSGLYDYSKIKQLFIMTIDEYNRLMNKNESLGENETIIFTTKTEYKPDTITIDGLETMNIKKRADEFIKNGIDSYQIMSSIFVFVPDKDYIKKVYESQAKAFGKNRSEMQDYYSFDLDMSEEEQIALYSKIDSSISELRNGDESFPVVECDSKADKRQSFYSLFGGLFMLGIVLSVVFIFAAVLIMYYKQVSEGFEDCQRFEIMQKVGMTKKEIRKSINSQVLTVFAIPLITAGIHTAFASPIIFKMLRMFGLNNTKLLIFVTVGCFLVFAFFYIIVYRITSKSYYSIVSGKRS